MAALFTSFVVLFSFSADARAVDDYQIAWIIPPIDIKQQEIWVGQGREIFRANLHPEKLFQTNSKVTAKDGTLLLAAGSRLVLMDYKKLLACSLEQGESGSVSYANRICLMDEDGDNAFDTYFARSFGKSIWTGDGQWFAMNRIMTEDRKPIQPFGYVELDHTNLPIAPILTIKYIRMLDKSKITSLVLQIEGMFGYEAYCRAYLPPEQIAAGDSAGECNVPGMNMVVIGRRDEDILFKIDSNNRPVHVRFSGKYGILSHSIDRVRLYY